MIEVSSATEIEAPAERVWSVLTDLAGFHAWNPFIREAHGTPLVGETVHVRVRPSFRVPLAFDATILERDDNHELRWYGQVLASWLARAEHTFTIERLGPNRVRFVQTERFAGLVPWLGKRLLAREAQRGFDAMNQALAARAQEAVS